MSRKYLHTYSLTDGDKCPMCEGTGSVLMQEDAHKSEGYVPCQFYTARPNPNPPKFGESHTTIHLRCRQGILRKVN